MTLPESGCVAVYDAPNSAFRFVVYPLGRVGDAMADAAAQRVLRAAILP